MLRMTTAALAGLLMAGTFIAAIARRHSDHALLMGLLVGLLVFAAGMAYPYPRRAAGALAVAGICGLIALPVAGVCALILAPVVALGTRA